jgi:hypothetical protein
MNSMIQDLFAWLNFDRKFKMVVLHALKLYEGSELQPYAFLTSTVDGVRCKSATLIVGKEHRYTVWVPETGVMVVLPAAYSALSLSCAQFNTCQQSVWILSATSGLKNLWHTSQKWHVERFPWHTEFHCCPNFVFLLPDQRLYIVKNVCIHTYTYLTA